MLSTSFAFRKYVADGRHLANKVELTFADGTTKTLYGEDLAMGGVSFSTASSSMGSFDIGSAIIGTASLSLANHDERWNDYDFTGATCAVSVGAVLDDDTVEWLRKGTYGIVQPELYDSTITLECHDNMRLFQVPYSDVVTTYPATLLTIVSDVCESCGVTMLSASFPHDSQVVPVRPSDENLSCLDVLSWAAQMAGCFCDVDTWGRLRIRWYDTSAYETEDWLDGGSYLTETTPYSDGDAADGGGFHTDVDDADGGDFTQTPWAVVSAIKSLSTATDDVVITGVRVTASDQVKADGTQGSKGESYLYGTEGYVLSVEGNALVTYGNAQSVATTIGPAIVGMRFRPLTVTAIGDPAIEAGDPMLVIDWRQRTFRSWVTSNTWKQGSYQSLGCAAETPARNSADAHSAITRAIVEQRNAMRAERTAREQAVASLAQQLAESSGLYMTRTQQQDQSYIYYMHDKPTLAESQIVWKLTANAFGISTDGGLTYPYGLDVTGAAILSRIYTIGLDASYINAGSISADRISAGTIQSVNGESSWNLSTGAMDLFARDSNLRIGRVTPIAGGTNRVDSLIELGDGMSYETRFGPVFSVTVDSYDSTSGTTKYRNAHMKLTNTQGTAGFYLETLSLQGGVKLKSDATFYINGGYDSLNSRDRLVINNNGTSPYTDIYGTTRATVTSWSDRRMKRHLAWLGDDACEFVRGLRPALFEFIDGVPQTGRHLGFYAQDVREVEPDGWDTVTVTEDGDESLEYDPLSLEYDAIIAPLVAYAQSLERRLVEQQEQIDRILERIDAAV